jgi:hypothetical protein
MSNPFFCWHNWGKWSDPVDGIMENTTHSMGYFRVIQMRQCERCGIAQTRKLPNMRSVKSLKEEK